GIHPPLPPARGALRLPAHPLLRLPGQLPPHCQTHSLSPTARHGLLPAPAPACRLPPLAGGSHHLQLSALPAVWQRNSLPTAILPTIPRPPSAPPGHLMMPPGPNPLSPRHCSSGRAHSTSAHTLSAAAPTPIATPHRRSESRFYRLPVPFRLPTHLL